MSFLIELSLWGTAVSSWLTLSLCVSEKQNMRVHRLRARGRDVFACSDGCVLLLVFFVCINMDCSTSTRGHVACRVEEGGVEIEMTEKDVSLTTGGTTETERRHLDRNWTCERSSTSSTCSHSPLLHVITPPLWCFHTSRNCLSVQCLCTTCACSFAR